MDLTTAKFFEFYILAGLFLAAATILHAKIVRAGLRPRSQYTSIGQAARRSGRAFVAFVASLPVTPNQLTAIGLLLVACNCVFYVLFRNAFWFGSGLIAALLFDTLDGLVARTQGAASPFGGYFDAVVDRYEEIAIYLCLGVVVGAWLSVFLAITGSMLTSYNKARVALEVPTSNKGWHDLLERPLRMVILCVGLIGAPLVGWLLPFSLWLLAGLTHFTALQRFIRAYFLLSERQEATSNLT